MTTLSTYPQWTTELTDDFVPGEDQLGIEGAAQGYQQWLIPGIITVTDRARYYSFYAWILYRFINDPTSSRLLKDFRGPFYKRHEMAMILGAYSHHKDREPISGVVGSGSNNVKVRSWWEATDNISLDTHYFQNKMGGFGQYYLTVMQTMGIVGPSEHPAWVYRLTHRGESLAMAYKESIASTKYSQKLEEAGQLTELDHEDALDFGKKGCICSEALAESKDLPLLRDAFFRLDQHGRDNPHVRRRFALAVTLDLVRGAESQFKPEFLRPALFLNEYSPGLVYKPTPELVDWAFRWKLVEIRHLYTFGLQSLWGAFLLQLKQSINGISISEFDDWLKETLGEQFLKQALTEYLDFLCCKSGLTGGWNENQKLFDHACQQASGCDEYSLFLKTFQGRTKSKVLLEHGIQILSQLFLRFLQLYLDDNPIWLEMARRERQSLTSFYQFTNDHLKISTTSLGDWLIDLYREYIWGQHEFMALEKLRYQDYDTFKFAYREGRFYWPFPKADAYREPVRLAANRLNNVLNILTDLGLIIKNDHSYLTLSSDGEYYLARCVEISHHDH